MKIPTLLLAVALLLMGGPADAVNEEVVIVARRDNPNDAIHKKDLAKLFLKQTTAWEGGTPANPVDLPEDSPVRERFSQQYLGKSAASVKKFWQEQIFSGRGTPPRELRSEADVLRYVYHTPGAVGYVSSSVKVNIFKGIKVLPVTD